MCQRAAICHQACVCTGLAWRSPREGRVVRPLTHQRTVAKGESRCRKTSSLPVPLQILKIPQQQQHLMGGELGRGRHPPLLRLPETPGGPALPAMRCSPCPCRSAVIRLGQGQRSGVCECGVCVVVSVTKPSQFSLLTRSDKPSPTQACMNRHITYHAET